MARRDYRRGRATGRRGGTAFMLFAGILLGLVVAGLMAWFLLPRASDFKRVAPAPEVRVPEDRQAAPPPAPPDYTFYDILPGNRTPKPAAAAAPTELWWLQVAALKSAADADALRARLALLNLNAVVQPTDGAEPLHRVRVGPYRSRDVAESAREALILNKFEARLLKEPVNP